MPYMGDPANYPPCTDCGCVDKPRYWAYFFKGRCKDCIDKEIAKIETQHPGMKNKPNPFIALCSKDEKQ